MFTRQNSRKHNVLLRPAPTGGLIAQISGKESNYNSLRRILDGDFWNIHRLSTCAEAHSWLSSHIPSVVVTDCALPDGTWKSVVELLDDVWCAPPVVVSCRLADELLWAEVLSSGAYDLLATPFEEREARRVIELAAGLTPASRASVRCASSVA